MTRPAESAAGIGSVVSLTALAAGASEPVVAALVAATGVLPIIVSKLVDAGGIRGAVRLIWQGRARG